MTFIEFGSYAGAGIAIIAFLGMLWKVFSNLNTMVDRTTKVPEIGEDVKALQVDVSTVIAEQSTVAKALTDHQALVASTLVDHQALVATALTDHQALVARTLLDYQARETILNDDRDRALKTIEGDVAQIKIDQHTADAAPPIGEQVDTLTEDMQTLKETDVAKKEAS